MEGLGLTTFLTPTAPETHEMRKSVRGARRDATGLPIHPFPRTPTSRHSFRSRPRRPPDPPSTERRTDTPNALPVRAWVAQMGIAGTNGRLRGTLGAPSPQAVPLALHSRGR